MNALEKKLKCRRGVTLIMALILISICSVVCTMILTAATAAARTDSNQEDQQQAYLSVESAANMFAQEICGQTATDCTTITYSDEKRQNKTGTDSDTGDVSMTSSLKGLLSDIWNGLSADPDSTILKNLTVSAEGLDDVAVTINATAKKKETEATTTSTPYTVTMTVTLTSGDASSSGYTMTQTYTGTMTSTVSKSSEQDKEGSTETKTYEAVRYFWINGSTVEGWIKGGLQDGEWKEDMDWTGWEKKSDDYNIVKVLTAEESKGDFHQVYKDKKNDPNSYNLTNEKKTLIYWNTYWDSKSSTTINKNSLIYDGRNYGDWKNPKYGYYDVTTKLSSTTVVTEDDNDTVWWKMWWSSTPSTTNIRSDSTREKPANPTTNKNQKCYLLAYTWTKTVQGVEKYNYKTITTNTISWNDTVSTKQGV